MIQKKVNHIIFIIIFCQFLVCLGMSLIFPVIPFIRNEYHFSAFAMGLMSSLYALAQFIMSPLVGHLSDWIGRKPVMVWGLIVFSLAEFLFAMTNQLWLFDLSRFVDGIAAAMLVPTVRAIAADITTIEDRAKVIGWLSASFSGGLILGPGIGGVLAQFSFKTPFWVAGILGLISTLVAGMFLPNGDYQKVDAGKQKTSANLPWHQAIKNMLNSKMIILFSMILIAAFGLAGFENIYSIYVNQVHHFSLQMIAFVLTVNGILSLILQVFLFNRLVQWMGELKIIAWGFMIGSMVILFVIYDHSQWQVAIATLVAFECFDMIYPAITTLLTKMATSNQGLLNGINVSLNSLGNIIGPLVSGALLDINYQYPYLLTIALLTLAMIMAFVMDKRKIAN